MSNKAIEQVQQTQQQSSQANPKTPTILSYFWDDLAPGNSRALPKNYLYEAKVESPSEALSTSEQMTLITT